MDINKWIKEYEIASESIEIPCGDWDCIISRQEYLNEIDKFENK